MKNIQLHHDPGLQPERTVLAWGRTVVSCLLVSLGLLRWLPTYPHLVSSSVSLALILTGWCLATQRQRYRRQSLGIVKQKITPALGLIFATGLSVSLAATSFAIVLLLEPR
ncbi:DUF202 domain-containing protein [Halomonas cupida]|uniref:DUF202 domain-containing protein n=1 Tax=Halomonas cupida TaxID=44933 RepID=UPI000A01D7DE